jgi:hypothetical protein
LQIKATVLLCVSMSRTEVSAYYSLDFNMYEEPAIVLETPSDSLREIANTDLSESYREDLGLARPLVYGEYTWGYGGIGQVQQSTYIDGWSRINFLIPDLSKDLGEHESPNRTALLEIAASIALPLHILNANIRDWEDRRPTFLSRTDLLPQLVTARLEVEPEDRSYGAGIYAKLKPPMIRWLAGNISEELAGKVSQSMQTTYSRLAGTFDYDEFPVALRSETDIHLDVPGNSTGLDPAIDRHFRVPEDEREVKLIPHNVDHTAQQIALLAGVTTLAGTALKSLLGPNI